MHNRPQADQRRRRRRSPATTATTNPNDDGDQRRSRLRRRRSRTTTFSQLHAHNNPSQPPTTALKPSTATHCRPASHRCCDLCASSIARSVLCRSVCCVCGYVVRVCCYVVRVVYSSVCRRTGSTLPVFRLRGLCRPQNRPNALL